MDLIALLTKMHMALHADCLPSVAASVIPGKLPPVLHEISRQMSLPSWPFDRIIALTGPEDLDGKEWSAEGRQTLEQTLIGRYPIYCCVVRCSAVADATRAALAELARVAGVRMFAMHNMDVMFA